jgi:hypothetical protein
MKRNCARCPDRLVNISMASGLPRRTQGQTRRAARRRPLTRGRRTR